MHRKAGVALLAVLAALLLVAAGCGGSSDEASDDTAIEETVTETAGSGDEEEGESMDDESEMGTDDDAGSVFDIADEDCLELAQAGAKIAEAVDPSGNFDAEGVASFYEELASNAPEEIQDDLLVFAGYMAEVAEAFQGIDLSSGAAPSPEALAALQALSDIGPEVQQASENLSAWATENCTVGG